MNARVLPFVPAESGWERYWRANGVHRNHASHVEGCRWCEADRAAEPQPQVLVVPSVGLSVVCR